MSFQTRVVERAWRRSGGRCECVKVGHQHVGRCNKPLAWANRSREGPGRWDAYSVSTFHKDYASDCRILCWNCGRRAN